MSPLRPPMTPRLPLSRRDFLLRSGAGLASLACLPSRASAELFEAAAGPALPSWTPRVALVGIGAVGAHLVARMHAWRLPGVDCIAIDAGALDQEGGAAGMRLVLGLGLKRGLSVGRREVDIGAAVAHRASIAGALANTDLVVLVSSLGGHMVTATTPFVAQLAREAGALTMAVVTTPFGLEGRRRLDEARTGLRDLDAICDSTIVVSSDRAIESWGWNVPLREIVDCRDDAVCRAVRAIAGAVTLPGPTCVVFADVHAAFGNRGAGAVGLGVSAGADRAALAAAKALSCPLLRECDVTTAGSVLVEVAAGALRAEEIERAARVISRTLDPEATVVVGSTKEPHLGETLRVTLVAAGAPV